MFLSIFGSNDFLQFVVLQFLFTQTTLWLSFNVPLVGGRGTGKRFPGALTTPAKEGNVNGKSQKECLRLVEAGWLVGKKQLVINCAALLGFYLGFHRLGQGLFPLTLLDSPLSSVCTAVSVSSFPPEFSKAGAISSIGSLWLLLALVAFSLTTPPRGLCSPITFSWFVCIT